MGNKVCAADFLNHGTMLLNVEMSFPFYLQMSRMKMVFPIMRQLFLEKTIQTTMRLLKSSDKPWNCCLNLLSKEQQSD